MSASYYAQMTDGELVGHVMALADDASEISQALATRLRVQNKLRSDSEMRERLAQDRIYKLEREVRELKQILESE